MVIKPAPSRHKLFFLLPDEALTRSSRILSEQAFAYRMVADVPVGVFERRHRFLLGGYPARKARRIQTSHLHDRIRRLRVQ